MAHYVARIPVSVTRSAAFAYLSRFDRAEEWDPGVEAGEMLTAEPVGVGCDKGKRSHGHIFGPPAGSLNGLLNHSFPFAFP